MVELELHLSFFIPPKQYVALADVPATHLANPELFDAPTEQAGVLRIKYGELETDMGDILIYGIPAICHRGLLDLAAGATFEHFSNAGEGSVTLTKVADEIELGGLYRKSLRFPAAAFAHALFELGAEFRQVTAQIWPDETEFIDGLAELEEAARTVVDTF